MTRPFLLHLGYGKTGTSTLQRALFDKLHQQKRIYYFGMFSTDQSQSHSANFFNRLTRSIYLDDVMFYQNILSLREEFEHCVRSAKADLPLVLSNEHFLTSHYSTSRPGAYTIVARTAYRLRELFKNYEPILLIGLRRQDNLLHSFYSEHASRPIHANRDMYKDLDDYLNNCLDSDHLFFSMYDYNQAINKYIELFKSPSHFIYTFEKFCDCPEEIFASILLLLRIRISDCQHLMLSVPKFNSKKKTDKGVLLDGWSPLQKTLHSIPAGRSIGRLLKQTAIGRAINERTKIQKVIRNLTPSERDRIFQIFAPRNRALIHRWPQIEDSFVQHGYVL